MDGKNNHFLSRGQLKSKLMKTLFTYSTLMRTFGLLIVALTLNSCGAFYPYAYYYSGNASNNAYAYRERAPKQTKNYSVYFSDKANEYNEILGEEVVIIEDQDAQNESTNKQVNIQLVIDSSPYNYGYYSWGFRPYWDVYYAYSPYVNYGYYNPYFYDQWYWRYSSSYYNWGYNYWWSPFPYSNYAYIYSPYRHNHYFNSPSRNRGRSNQDRSSYRSSRILGYGSNSIASNTKGRVSSMRSLNNTGRSSINSSTRDRGRTSIMDLRSSNDSRLRGYRMPSNNTNTNTRSNIRTRSYNAPTRSSIQYTPNRSSTIKRSSSNTRSNNNTSNIRRSSPIRSSSVRSSGSYSPRPAVSRSSSSRSSSSGSRSSSSSSRKQK